MAVLIRVLRSQRHLEQGGENIDPLKSDLRLQTDGQWPVTVRAGKNCTHLVNSLTEQQLLAGH